ncbi:hypothetical protein OHT57_29965 [Streptomyces sp. NBC_00285]|uniref:hypothetical protein n=1 Tax=Streptomyces sp. NBC_00285 TaxID=2975700 RepID=UPI002E2DA89B|nr:hypothetical protein [Streptomyces sp. NBC_00285]
MPSAWKITVIVLAVAGIVTTPVVWLLNGPDGGQFAGASIQAATGVAALVWAVRRPAAVSGPRDEVIGSGDAEASGGGEAHAGIRRPGGRGRGWARVKRSGKATARGPGAKSGTGIDYTP